MEYSDKVMDHFANPRNVGEIKDADGVGKVGNVKCGDVMYIYIKVGRRKLGAGGKGSKLSTSNSKPTEEYIEDIKFKTLGCAAAIAASSMMTELARGKSLKEAENITRDDINESLGKLPSQKYHCSILSAEGIRKAIDDYRSKQQ